MIFRVTHIDGLRQRRRAHVTACNVSDCIDQVESELGDYLGLVVIRLSNGPLLQLCPSFQEIKKRGVHA